MPGLSKYIAGSVIQFYYVDGGTPEPIHLNISSSLQHYTSTANSAPRYLFFSRVKRASKQNISKKNIIFVTFS